jgi:ribosomal protein S18 acetylase RimI-like enzyme
MNDTYIIRKANAGDKAFITEAIIAAEKAGTEKIGLATLFDLEEPEIRKIILQILDEDIPGSELSLDSFIVAQLGDHLVAAVAGWIESFAGRSSSASIKSNFIHVFFPQKNLLAARPRLDLIREMRIERERQTLQIEYVYVSEAHRGAGLAARLIDQHIAEARDLFPELEKVQVQVFKNNTAANRLYERAGFVVTNNFRAVDKEILKYLPGDEKLLMEKQLRNE